MKNLFILVWYYEPKQDWGYPMAIPYNCRADAESAQTRVKTDVNSPSVIVEITIPIERGAADQFGLGLEATA